MERKKKKQEKLDEELKEEQDKKKKKEMAELQKKMAEDKLEALRKTAIGAKVFSDITAEVSSTKGGGAMQWLIIVKTEKTV